MSKKKHENSEGRQSLEATLLALATPKMSPKELLKAARKVHPDASKKEIVRAAFRSLIVSADHHSEAALALHDFAIRERGNEEG